MLYNTVLFIFILKTYLLTVLDSDGKPSSGILRGGLIWTGHFDECYSAFAPEDNEGHGGFFGKYCVTTWNLNLGGEVSVFHAFFVLEY